MSKATMVISVILLVVMCSFVLCGCIPDNSGLPNADNPNENKKPIVNEPSDDNPSTDEPKPNDPATDDKPKSEYVSRVMSLPSGKTYLEVDGKPFAIRGGQIRIDGLQNRSDSFKNAIDPLTYDEIEVYFAKAKKCGLNTVELAMEWSKIELSKDVYDFTHVDKLLAMANKYGLKCEFLWFSTNMCGDTHTFPIPSYIYEDEQTYPRLQAKNVWWSHMYGQLFYLVLNSPALMQREALVLTKLMEHVYEWNEQNGSKNPLIGMQIHNESDGLLRWRLEQKELKLNGVDLTPEQVWQMTLEALDNAGKAVKSSKYRIYTRCNMTVSYGVDEFPQHMGHNLSPLDILALDGIDIIGDDPYVTSPTLINDIIGKYSVNGNYPHVAENMGNYASSPSMFLTTYQAGGSYMFYDLATPQYFIQLNGGGSYQMDQGLLNPDFSYKAHTEETIRIINGIAAMDSVLPLVASADFAAFNVLKETNQQQLTQTINTSSISLTYTTEKGGVAFAIEYEGYVYLYSTQDCKFTINNADFVYKAEIGRFDGFDFSLDSEKYINPTIALEACKLHRIKIRNVNEQVTSTTCDFV